MEKNRNSLVCLRNASSYFAVSYCTDTDKETLKQKHSHRNTNTHTHTHTGWVGGWVGGWMDGGRESIERACSREGEECERVRCLLENHRPDTGLACHNVMRRALEIESPRTSKQIRERAGFRYGARAS